MGKKGPNARLKKNEGVKLKKKKKKIKYTGMSTSIS